MSLRITIEFKNQQRSIDQMDCNLLLQLSDTVCDFLRSHGVPAGYVKMDALDESNQPHLLDTIDILSSQDTIPESEPQPSPTSPSPIQEVPTRPTYQYNPFSPTRRPNRPVRQCFSPLPERLCCCVCESDMIALDPDTGACVTCSFLLIE